MIYVVLLLLFSLAINGVFVWYTRKLLQDPFFVSSNIEGLYEQVDGFSSHLQEVHKRETYYGDPTLEGLIQHSKELVEEMQEYRNVFILGQEDEEDEEEEDVYDDADRRA